MQINVDLKEDDKGTPIEFASAIINYHMAGVDPDDFERYQAQKNKLAEIAEHIETFVGYN